MSITICNKCRGPVTVEDGKYVCALCGAVHGDAQIAIAKNYSDYFKNRPLVKAQEISRNIANKIAFWGTHEKNDPRAIYTIIPLSNGQYYTRFLPGVGYDSTYRGQCAVENWFSVNSIYATQEHTVAIAEDGTLQPTLIEVENLFNRIKSSGLSDMRMKQIVDLSYQHCYAFSSYSGTVEDSFIGLDIYGKVVIYNPFEALDLDSDDDQSREQCAKIMKTIKAWPTMDKIYHESSLLIGITQVGDVYAVPTSRYTDDEDEALAAQLSNWTNIDSIITDYYVSSSLYGSNETVLIGLKKDGTLISNSSNAVLSNYLSKSLSDYEDIAQIAFKEFNGRTTKLAYLNSQGEFYIGSTKIADNAISIISKGYVHVDGSIYELVREMGNVHEPIQSVQLFDSVETFENENKERSQYVLSLKSELDKKHKIILDNTNVKRKELDTLNTQYSNLGLFKGKEKKALKPSIDNLSQEVKSLETELTKIEEELDTIPSGKAAWKHFDLPTSGTYSISQISAAAYQAVSYKKSGTSVIGSAVAGAVVAGPAGAIVGAIYAADKNRKNK